MEQKTKVEAEAGRLDLFIKREFDLPLDLLFKAYEEPEIVEQWMSNGYSTTKLLQWENKKHGAYRMETTDGKGTLAFRANGVFHEFITDRRIVRTFEMEGTPFGIQLEVYDFEAVSGETSRLTMHVIYESLAQRDAVLKLPFAQGLNMAHNRIQELAKQLK